MNSSFITSRPDQTWSISDNAHKSLNHMAYLDHTGKIQITLLIDLGYCTGFPGHANFIIII